MNSFDTTLIVIIAVFTIRGVFRGLITELTVLIALITGYILGFMFMSDGVHLLQKYFPALPEFAAKMTAFALIFVTVNIVLRLLAKMLNKVATFTFMQPINRSAGGLFAAAKATLILSIAFLVLEFLPFTEIIQKNIGAKESSLYQPVKSFAPMFYKAVTAILPEDANLQEKFEQTIQKADSTAKEYIPPIY